MGTGQAEAGQAETYARIGRSITTLLGSVGAHILAVFLFVAGVLLLTGASVAGVIFVQPFHPKM